jgi:DnaD/phage-associated family protein
MEVTFEGYPEDEIGGTSLPPAFFREILPTIDHLGELKVTLCTFWYLDHKEGAFRYLTRDDYSQDERLMETLGETGAIAQKVLDESLERAVNRGSILKAEFTLEDRLRCLYFLNTTRGQAAVQAIDRGEWQFTGDVLKPIEFRPEKPNIFRLYEGNIGPLTPLVAETLKEAEESYPPEWIEEAIHIAVENNARNWRYVEAVLERWQLKGRDERKDRRDTEKDRRKYKEWESPDR